jgi:hypothetical protein
MSSGFGSIGAASAPPSLLAVGAAYMAVSSMMVVVNKAAMLVFPWPTTLSGIQFVFSALAVYGGALQVESS